MNVLTGEVVEIYVEDGKSMGKVSVNGAFAHVALMLLMDAKVGDTVLIDSGVALSRVETEELIDE
jgi:hydrogenase maturation factor